jgi:hypothetical protein
MPTSRGRPPRRKAKSGGAKPGVSKGSDRPKKSGLGKPVRAWWNLASKIIVGLATAASLLGGYVLVIAELSPPVITPSAGQGEEPFVLRTSVKNGAIFFPIRRLNISCHIDKYLSKGAGVTINMENDDIGSNRYFEIEPGKSVQYNCPVHYMIVVQNEVSSLAKIHLDITYFRFGKKFQTKSEELNWDVKSRQWTMGQAAY